jgi:hypothetical protein
VTAITGEVLVFDNDAMLSAPCRCYVVGQNPGGGLNIEKFWVECEPIS